VGGREGGGDWNMMSHSTTPQNALLLASPKWVISSAYMQRLTGSLRSEGFAKMKSSQLSLSITGLPDGVDKSSKSPYNFTSERKAVVVSCNTFRRGEGLLERPLQLNSL
jgi:hypothetical protein